MSAAEATTPHEADPGPRAGAVIRMSDRRPTTGRTPRTPAAGPAPATGPAAVDGPLEQQLAEHMEALFHAHGMTLTDEDTVEVYAVALEAVAMMLKGALVDGALTDGPHATLQAMLAGMKKAPELL